jgi:uroporphyrin-III C-methyltransferase
MIISTYHYLNPTTYPSTDTSMTSYLEPQGGGSLMLAFKSQANSVLIIGSNTIAATRAFVARDADYDILILAPGNLDNACPEIRYRVDNGQAEILNWDNIFTDSEEFAHAVGKLLGDKAQISFVCVCDTSLREGRNRRSFGSAKQIYDACRSHRVPINVADIPELCSFTFPASHRFSNPESGSMTPLQISVTTNGKGCRLGGRFKREIVSKLPKLAGVAVEKIGRLRELSQSVGSSTFCDTVADTVYLDAAISPSPNEPILPLPQTASDVEKSQQRMRWVAQISEFWQIERLAGLNQPDMESLLQENQAVLNANTEKVEMVDPTVNHQPSHLGGSYMHAEQSRHGLTLTAPSGDRGGKIYLLGSGIGHPSLLTVAAHEILTRRATLVLSDKLVPSAILNLIPAGVQVRIARKFPGNADQAQRELMELATEAAERGEIVARVVNLLTFRFVRTYH